MPIEIFIVDDHQIVREGVRSLLTALRPEWSISEAADGTQLLELVQKRKPDAIVMDITMPGASGLELVTSLRKAGFDSPILMFTMHQSAQLGSDTKRVGAQGYVLKSQAVEDLVRAIDALLAGGTFYGTPSVPRQGSKHSKSGFSFCLGLRPVFT